jgi:hypothetical protein
MVSVSAGMVSRMWGRGALHQVLWNGLIGRSAKHYEPLASGKNDSHDGRRHFLFEAYGNPVSVEEKTIETWVFLVTDPI